MNTGTFNDLPEAIYRAAAGLNQSLLKHLERSPAHFRVAAAQPSETSAALRLGSLVHARILQPDQPLPRFAIKPDGMKFSTTEGKDWRKARLAEGLEIIDGADYQAILGVTQAVKAHSLCRTIFADGAAEISLFWRQYEDWTAKDPADQRSTLCKARIDFVPAGNCLADVKTCQDARTGGSGTELFSSHAFALGYHIQCAWYLDGWNLLNPDDRKEVYLLIAVEKEPPYAVAVHQLTPAALQHGRDTYRRLLARYLDCEEAGNWPAYPEEITPLAPPEWAVRAA